MKVNFKKAAAVAALATAGVAANAEYVYAGHFDLDTNGDSVIDAFQVELCDGPTCFDRVWRNYGALSAAVFNSAATQDGFKISAIARDPFGDFTGDNTEIEQLAKAFGTSHPDSTPIGDLTESWVSDPATPGTFALHALYDGPFGILDGYYQVDNNLNALGWAFCDAALDTNGKCQNGDQGGNVSAPGTLALTLGGLALVGAASVRRRREEGSAPAAAPALAA